MILVTNKKAKRDFSIQKEYQAGIVLLGSEVKSLRQKKASFADSFVKVIGGELFLINCQINPYNFADNRDYDPKRTRKLLVSKKEIEQISSAIDKKNTTIIPLSFALVRNKIKLYFAIAKGKKEFEKREDLKKKAIQRDLDRELKNKIRLK